MNINLDFEPSAIPPISRPNVRKTDDGWGVNIARAGTSELILPLLTELAFIEELRKGGVRRLDWSVPPKLKLARETRGLEHFGPEGYTICVGEKVMFPQTFAFSRSGFVFVPLTDPDATHRAVSLEYRGTAWQAHKGFGFGGFHEEGRRARARDVVKVIQRLAPEILQDRTLFCHSAEELQRIGREVLRASPFGLNAAAIPEAAQAPVARRRL
jgi:hypothetical protein